MPAASESPGPSATAIPPRRRSPAQPPEERVARRWGPALGARSGEARRVAAAGAAAEARRCSSACGAATRRAEARRRARGARRTSLPVGVRATTGSAGGASEGPGRTAVVAAWVGGCAVGLLAVGPRSWRRGSTGSWSCRGLGGGHWCARRLAALGRRTGPGARRLPPGRCARDACSTWAGLRPRRGGCFGLPRVGSWFRERLVVRATARCVGGVGGAGALVGCRSVGARVLARRPAGRPCRGRLACLVTGGRARHRRAARGARATRCAGRRTVRGARPLPPGRRRREVLARRRAAASIGRGWLVVLPRVDARAIGGVCRSSLACIARCLRRGTALRAAARRLSPGRRLGSSTSARASSPRWGVAGSWSCRRWTRGRRVEAIAGPDGLGRRLLAGGRGHRIAFRSRVETSAAESIACAARGPGIAEAAARVRACGPASRRFFECVSPVVDARGHRSLRRGVRDGRGRSPAFAWSAAAWRLLPRSTSGQGSSAPGRLVSGLRWGAPGQTVG